MIFAPYSLKAWSRCDTPSSRTHRGQTPDIEPPRAGEVLVLLLARDVKSAKQPPSDQ